MSLGKIWMPVDIFTISFTQVDIKFVHKYQMGSGLVLDLEIEISIAKL